MKSRESWVWGFHSVEAVLENYPELCVELILESPKNKSDAAFEKITFLAKEHGIRVSAASVPRTLAEHRHQGAACRIKSFPLQDMSDFVNKNSPDSLAGVWVLLDRVQDPRNYGAILRSAAAFGIRGVFVGDKEQSPLTGVVAQASAGNVFRVPVIENFNLNKVTDFFADAAAQIFGLDMEGLSVDALSHQLQADATVLWILGSEGKGLREGLAKRCTSMVKIPMAKSVESLNVSSAAAIAFYATHKISLG